MKFSVAVFLAVAVLPVRAECPLSDQLVKRYGISFSGIKADLPRVKEPRLNGNRTEDLIVIRLPNKKGLVPDGFSHSALIGIAGKKAWIRRVGGFLSVLEWYGPVELSEINLDGCVFEKYRK